VRRLAIMVSVALAACASPEAPEVQARRDGVSGAVVVVGPADAGLGVRVVACEDKFLAASASGRVWWSADGTFSSPPGNDVLGCFGASGLPVPFSGSRSGMSQYSVGGVWLVSALFPASDAISRSPDLSTIIISESGGKAFRANGTTGLADMAPFFRDAGVAAIAWPPAGNTVGLLFATVDPPANVVRVFQALGPPMLSALIVPPSGVQLRPVIAMGHFHPGSPGAQVAVSANNGRVLIFDRAGGAPLMTLEGATPSFGASLEVGSPLVADLHRLFVGEPDLDQVSVMVGDAGILTFSASGRYGTSLSMDSQNGLLVGAPDYDGGGAVFRVPTVLPSVRIGEAKACVVGAPCVGSVGCNVGVCVGGVACADQMPGCPPEYRCVNASMLEACVRVPDAGAPDAGPLDAGPPDAGGPDDAGLDLDAGRDAGASLVDAGADAGPDAGADAGVADAGSLDAETGPLTFRTSGCSSVGVFPLVALGLLTLRRRRNS